MPSTSTLRKCKRRDSLGRDEGVDRRDLDLGAGLRWVGPVDRRVARIVREACQNNSPGAVGKAEPVRLNATVEARVQGEIAGEPFKERRARLEGHNAPICADRLRDASVIARCSRRCRSRRGLDARVFR